MFFGPAWTRAVSFQAPFSRSGNYLQNHWLPPRFWGRKIASHVVQFGVSDIPVSVSNFSSLRSFRRPQEILGFQGSIPALSTEMNGYERDVERNCHCRS